jgi:hypothetical protein
MLDILDAENTLDIRIQMIIIQLSTNWMTL